MKQPKFTWWWKKHTPDGDSDEKEYPPPFCSTPGQEDRYRRLVAILEESEEENARMRRLDPKRESDQSQGLHKEKLILEEAVHNCGAYMHLGDNPRQRDRILAGHPQKDGR